jgi:hypothetical protein
MDKTENKFYEPEFKIDGTMPQLIDWCYRYDGDYTNDALERIAKLAESYGFDPSVPRLVREQRIQTQKAKDEGIERIDYEQLKLDKLVYGQIFGIDEAMSYGQVTVFEDRDKVLINVHGINDEGEFDSANCFTIEEFMSGDSNWLEYQIGALLASSAKSYTEVDA